jgi:hypothetical protein
MKSFDQETERPIIHRQNDPEMLDLLRAMFASHRRARTLTALRFTVTIAVATSGLVATFFSWAATTVVIVGTLWALLYSVGLASWGARESRQAATIQEMFDRKLYRLDWNEALAGQQVSQQDINGLAKKYRGRRDMIENYNEIPELPPPYDIVACQLQNLGWGARVRRRYGQFVLACLALWGLGGIVVGLFAGLTVADILIRWYVPSLTALLLGMDTYRAQREIVNERDRGFNLLQNRVDQSLSPQAAKPPIAGLLGTLDRVQDVIFLTRKSHVRVPEVFFSVFRQSDRDDFRSVVANLEARLAKAKTISGRRMDKPVG